MRKDHIAQIRSFNRFYTSVTGLLDKHYLNSNFSLTEVRIMYELYHQPEGITASGLIELLRLDKGYISRILRVFKKNRLIEKKQSHGDRRSFYLFLTSTGKVTFSKLNSASQQHMDTLLSSLPYSQSVKLIGHMNAIRKILQKANI